MIGRVLAMLGVVLVLLGPSVLAAEGMAGACGRAIDPVPDGDIPTTTGTCSAHGPAPGAAFPEVAEASGAEVVPEAGARLPAPAG